jgi:hypothetical protein
MVEGSDQYTDQLTGARELAWFHAARPRGLLEDQRPMGIQASAAHMWRGGQAPNG